MKVHFIGIGGIGVSALAQYYLTKGHQVSGSDLMASEITDFLRSKGILIKIGNLAENIEKDFDLVIYSPAVQQDNPELAKAKSFKIKTMSYPEALGELTRQYYTIAVAGSHGKSTTTAMIGLVLQKAKLDPTVLLGTKLKEFGDSNFRQGSSSRYLVIEACEYDGSFLNYSPKIIVITNVDREHLDYFKTLANVVKAFKDFILRLSADGFLVLNRDDKNIRKIENTAVLEILEKAGVKIRIENYGLYQAEAVKLRSTLKIPGQHNVSNALAALAVARILDISDEISFKALSGYRGSWRRFQIFNKKLKTVNYKLISDYGHHPTEILATLKAAREKYPKENIWCIFQPHQYQRTYYLFDDFVKIFRKVLIDHIIITDIYDVAGREEENISSSVNSKNLVKKIKKAHVAYLPLADAEKYVKENLKKGDILMIMGAGDIYKLVDKF